METLMKPMNLAVRTNDSSVICVRGKRFLVRREVEEKIGNLVLPQSRREELKESVIIAAGNEIDSAFIEQGKTKAVYFDGKGVRVSNLENDDNVQYELVKDEDVLMLINNQ